MTMPGAPLSLETKHLRDFIVLSLMGSHTIGLTALLIFTTGLQPELRGCIWFAYGIWAYWAAVKVHTHWGDEPKQNAPDL